MEEIVCDLEARLRGVDNKEVLKVLRSEYLGASGCVTALLRNLSNLSSEEKKRAGPRVNAIKTDVDRLLRERECHIDSMETIAKLESERIDLSMPAYQRDAGSLHLVNSAMDEVSNILRSMGFTYVAGPEIEDDFHNFTALNTADGHPARQMQDTFYLKQGLSDSGRFGVRNILRTQTSNAQIRVMLEHAPPLAIISPGRVFRRDFDATHTPMFHQIEGLCVHASASMAELKGCVERFIREFFHSNEIQFRFRPSYFPFTEPSMEVDIKMCSGSQWLEIMGCGIVHPNVMHNVGIDSDKFTGFAFGMGIERLVMLKYGIEDIRRLFDTDIRWLNQHNLGVFTTKL